MSQNREKTIRCLVVGLGNITKATFGKLSNQPWLEIVGVIDPREEARRAFAAEFTLDMGLLSTSFEQALAKGQADAVIIHTPPQLHYAQVKLALEAGLHVMVAKAFAMTYAEAEELVLLAESKGLTVSVGHQLPYNRHNRTLKHFLESGKLGQVDAAFFMNSKPRPQVGNLGSLPYPAIIEASCHHFDNFFTLFDDRLPEAITCHGSSTSWSPYRGACMINAVIELSGGLTINYHGGFSSQSHMYDYRLEGSKGALRCRGLHMSHDQMEYEYATPMGQFEKVHPDEGMDKGCLWSQFFEDWGRYLRGEAEPAFSGRKNLKTMALIDAGMRSMREGCRIEIKGDPQYQSLYTASLSGVSR